MRRLTCTSCGATLAWDGVSEIVSCSFCGARYQMRTSHTNADTRLEEAMRSGVVADRPCLSPGDDYGRVYYRAYLPRDWTYNVEAPDYTRYGASIQTPLCPVIEMRSPDGRSLIRHITSNAYEERTSPLQGMAGPLLAAGLNNLAAQIMRPDDGHLDDLSFTRYRPLTSAAAYCDEVAQLIGGVRVTRILAESTSDAFASSRMEQLRSRLPEDQGRLLWFDWCRRTYGGSRGSEPYAVVVEAQVSTNGFNSPRAPYGLPHLWRSDYELILVCPPAELNKLLPEFEQVRTSIELGRDFAETEQRLHLYLTNRMQQARQVAESSVANMLGARSASYGRRSQIIQDTHNQIMDTMHSTFANTAATHDRVAGLHQEMAREVNSYAGFNGQPIQADLRYDHVFGYTPDQRTYVATEGEWCEPGVDFTELPRL